MRMINKYLLGSFLVLIIEYKIFLIIKIGLGLANCIILLLKLKEKYIYVVKFGLSGPTLGENFSNVLKLKSPRLLCCLNNHLLHQRLCLHLLRK
jgi:hypothetical protein